QGPQGPQGPIGIHGLSGNSIRLSTSTTANNTTETMLFNEVVTISAGRSTVVEGDIIVAINSPNAPVFLVTSIPAGSPTYFIVTFYGELKTASAEVNVDTLAELIEGSETVVVDVNEEDTALEIHLDASVTSKLDRALLQPLSAPTEDSVVVVTPQNGQAVVPVSQLGGVYSHYVNMTITAPSFSMVKKPTDVTINLENQTSFTIAFNVYTSAKYAERFTEETLLDFIISYGSAVLPFVNIFSFMSPQGSIDIFAISYMTFGLDFTTGAINIGCIGTYVGNDIFPLSFNIETTANSTVSFSDEVRAV
ncbi:MAG: hypothetical protein IKY67_05160, partial [Paludibacteraceae bacterium]|nr:hypothetical protein [Paludibacteraceae bacterium]